MNIDNIRTLEELQAALDEDLVWRKREFVTIKSLVTAKSSPEKLNYYMRSGVALIYAHWEGFIKIAGTAYLVYIANQRLTYSDLTNNFVAIAAKKLLNEAGASNKATIYTKVADFFSSGLATRCIFPKNVINTRSNLNSETLREITHILGIDYSQYETKARLIDETLLKRRNVVAHGEYIDRDVYEFVDLHATIINLMDLFSNQISNAASTKAYKKNP